MYILNNGVKMPKIGLGTYPLKGELCYNIVKEGIKLGYRLIDTATMYKNEEEIGKAIRDSNINRQDLFIVTKLPASVKTYTETILEFEKSLERLQLNYIDLYLIHSPHPWGASKKSYYKENIEVYKALEYLYTIGKVKSIGVSNFKIKDLENILHNTNIVPQVNQISYYIGSNKETRYNFCKNHNIFIQVHSPLARGAVLENNIVNKISKKYNVSAPQLAIKYYLQKETCPILQTSKIDRLQTNLKLDFNMEKSDIKILSEIKNIKRSLI